MRCHQATDLRTKIQIRIATLMNKGGGKPSHDAMEAAMALLDQKLSRGPVSDRDIKTIAKEAMKQSVRVSHQPQSHQHNSDNEYLNPEMHSNSSKDIYNYDEINPMPNDNNRQMPDRDSRGVALPSIAAGTHDLNIITTKAPRGKLASIDKAKLTNGQHDIWLQRENEEKERALQLKKTQREILDKQTEEVKKKREAERLCREEERKEMEALMEHHKFLINKERQEIHERTVNTGKFCLNQMLAANEERRKQKQKIHDDQVNFLKRLEEMEQLQAEADVKKKLEKQAEWKKVSIENEKKLKEKMIEREKEREKDKEYQRMYSEREERIEKERADMYQIIANKQASIQLSGSETSLKSKSKDKYLDEKIKSDYEKQIQEYQEEEKRRKNRIREEVKKCNDVLLQQIEEKKCIRAKRLEEERRAVEIIRKEEETYKEEERRKKLFLKAKKAFGVNNYLNAHKQMSQKEAQPIERSVSLNTSSSSTAQSPERCVTSSVM